MQAEKSRPNRAAAAVASRFCLWPRSLSLPEMDGAGDFNRLDEVCVAHILSFTSPRDVCRLSAVSRKFQAAAESEVPWLRFLPSDWWQLIPRSVSALHFSSKRDLFFRLSKSILIDDGRRCLWLEKSTGKKCWMVSSRDLVISRGDDERYWQWNPAPAGSSVFPEVAELIQVWWFDIRGAIFMADLSPNTTYAVRFILRHTPRHSGWTGPLIELSLRVEDDPLVQEQTVSLCPEQKGSALRPSKEHQGWMYVQVGEFLCRAARGKIHFRIHEPKVEFRIHDPKDLKTGILVAGVQVSPCSSDEETSDHQPKRKNPKMEKRIAKRMMSSTVPIKGNERFCFFHQWHSMLFWIDETKWSMEKNLLFLTMITKTRWVGQASCNSAQETLASSNTA